MGTESIQSMKLVPLMPQNYDYVDIGCLWSAAEALVWAWVCHVNKEPIKLALILLK